MAGYLVQKQDIGKLRKNYSPLWGLAFGLFFLVSIIQSSTRFHITAYDYIMMPYSEPVRVFQRVILFVCAGFAILSILFSLPDSKILFISSWGKNSMSIFLLHRFFTLIIGKIFPSDMRSIEIIGISFALAFVFCVLLGNDWIASLLNRLLSPTKKNESFCRNAIVSLVACSVAILVVADSVMPDLTSSGKQESVKPQAKTDPVYQVMSDNQEQEFDHAFKIVFSGDLILLEDQVKRGYNVSDATYDFHDCFKYTKDEISSADLAIGVLEGPLPGDPLLYSIGNFDDGKAIYLGFPDAWAEAIKDAGFDLVTTSNNHLLDRGEKSVYRTLDVLENLGLPSTGSYKNQQDKDLHHIHIIERDGLRIAALSYTYGTNYYKTEDLLSGNLSHITSFIVDPTEPDYEKVKESVKEDFDAAKALSPDLILVLPHMGEQFLDAPDEFQKAWHDNFVEFGADVILGDHTHSVQPAFLEEAGGKTVFTAYCPGNYANVYREHDGDASALIEVYIDRQTKRPIGGGIIPMWTSCPLDGNYRPVPIYDILTDPSLASAYTTKDLERVVEVHEHITGVMLDTPLSTDMIEPVYRFGKDGEGDAKYLKNFFDVEVVELEKIDNIKISSKKIREYIESGKMEKAQALLGRPYRIAGLVVEGNHNGRKIDFPTANLELDYPYVFPKEGVYIGYGYFMSRRRKAIIAVGTHPTVNQLLKPIIEVHIIDFNENLYGRELYVDFISYIRPIKQFESLEQLREQLLKDEEKAKNTLQ